MGKCIVHADDDIKRIPEGIGEGTKVRMCKADIRMVSCRPFYCFRKRTVADI